MNFWESNIWGTFNIVAVLLLSLLIANIIKRSIKPLRASLIPISVLGGGVLLVFAWLYNTISGREFFNENFFGGNGYNTMEMITYHTLALGFIASAFKTTEGKLSKQRTTEIFNTGVTTVSTYLLQAVVGMGLTMLIAALFVKDFFPAAGLLLPFGYGQGTGQALNYGTIYENDFGFQGGASFGLTIAALGFLSASIGGVIHLSVLKRKGLIKPSSQKEGAISSEQVQGMDEIPMQESIDKMTVQIALIAVAYMLAYFIMLLLGKLLPGMKSVIFGFNFLLGVLAATIVKFILKLFRKYGWNRRTYTNDFLMTRACNFFFDIMVVSGIAAIRLSVLEKYWGIMLILGIVGLVITYVYNYYIAKKLFPAYSQEQFLAMFGMLTGTASTGVILLREIDGDFKTPVSDNLVYQNFPAIVFGFPIMLLATLAPVKPMLTLGLLFVFFVVMNIILFRSFIFKKKKK